ncbi:unnamed protein product, partial [Polarella glacialis]
VAPEEDVKEDTSLAEETSPTIAGEVDERTAKLKAKKAERKARKEAETEASHATPPEAQETKATADVEVQPAEPPKDEEEAEAKPAEPVKVPGARKREKAPRAAWADISEVFETLPTVPAIGQQAPSASSTATAPAAAPSRAEPATQLVDEDGFEIAASSRSSVREKASLRREAEQKPPATVSDRPAEGPAESKAEGTGGGSSGSKPAANREAAKQSSGKPDAELPRRLPKGWGPRPGEETKAEAPATPLMTPAMDLPKDSTPAKAASNPASAAGSVAASPALGPFSSADSVPSVAHTPVFAPADAPAAGQTLVRGGGSKEYLADGDRLKGQSYGGGLPLSEFNKLVPPGWRPGIPGYPIKLFFERLKLWYRVTDNAEAQLGILVAGRLQGAPQKIALRLRLPRPVAAGGGYDIGDEALIRLSQEQVIDPANNTIVQEYIPSGLQFLCQALRAIYGLQDQDRTTVALDSFYEFKRGHLGLAEFAQEFDHRYESAEDEAGLQMNDTGKTYFFLRGSGLGDKIIEDIKLQMRGDMSRYQEIRTLVLKLARANDKDKETLNMYQDQTDFNYKVNLDETNGNYYGSWHDPTTGEIIEYDYGANTSDDMYYGDYDCVYDGEYSDYDGAGYDDDWYGDDGWQDEVYHGDFPLEEWTWPASAPDSSTVSTAETTLLDVDPSYWKGQTKGKGKGFGAKGKGPSGGSASGIGCTTCGSRWHSSLDCPLNDPSKGDQGKGKGGKDYHYENFWKGKGKGKKGGKSKGFGKGWSKGFGKYRPSFGSGKGYGKYSGGHGKSYGKSYGKGKFKGGYGGFRYSSPYNFTAFQDYEVQEAPEHAPTIAFKADGSGTQYYDFEDDKPSSSTRPPPQSTTEPMIDTAGNPGYNDGYGELDTATAPVPDVRVNSLSFLVGACSSAFPTDHEDWSSLYRSVRGVKRHGLLIDPGAASGLIGSDTLKEFRDEILLPLGVDIIYRPTTQNVSGISGKPEPALSRVTMPIFPGIKSSTFTADVIGKQGSKCPALLPNPSMRAANMGLLTNFFESGDGMLIVHDNGKRLLYRCLLTESGHYILPTDNVKNNNNVDKEATRKASAFYAAVLQDATQQRSDISSVYLAVDKAAVADPVADRAPPSTRSTGTLKQVRH